MAQRKKLLNYKYGVNEIVSLPVPYWPQTKDPIMNCSVFTAHRSSFTLRQNRKSKYFQLYGNDLRSHAMFLFWTQSHIMGGVHTFLTASSWNNWIRITQ